MFSPLAERIRSQEEQWREESCARQSLEQRLLDISSALDETDYNLVPVRVRETLRQSAQFQPAQSQPAQSQPAQSQSAQFQPAQSQPAQFQPAQSQPAFTSPANLTQLSADLDNSGTGLGTIDTRSLMTRKV